MVQNVRGLNDFKMKSRLKRFDRPNLNFTGGTHGLAPDDFATIYNVTPLYAGCAT